MPLPSNDYVPGQNLLIDHMRYIKYDANQKGVCFGFANMALQAILSNDLASLTKRIDFLGKSLLEFKADPNMPGEKGNTPLLKALLADVINIEIINELLKYNADVNICVNSPGTRFSLTPLVALLESEIDEKSKLDLVERFLKLGADPNKPTAPSNTALYKAIETHASDEVVQMLLNYGADPGVKCFRNMTPLKLAEDMTEKNYHKMMLSSMEKLNTQEELTRPKDMVRTPSISTLGFFSSTRPSIVSNITEKTLKVEITNNLSEDKKTSHKP